MATVSKDTMAAFMAKYPDVSEAKIIEAAEAAGDVNGDTRQVRGLIVRNILSKGGHTGEPEVRRLFKNDNPQALIDDYYEAESHH